MAKKERTSKPAGKGLQLSARGKKNKFPSRSAINLVYKPKTTEQDIIALIMFAVFMIALAVFTKFMVLDQLAAVNEAERAYHEKERQLQVLVKANEEFDEVEDEYSHYGISYMTSEELNRQNRSIILQVVDEKVSSEYDIRTINIAGNTVTLTFTVPELQDVSEIVSSLNESPLVSYVTFSTAATQDERVRTEDENGKVVIETVRSNIAANITVYFKTPAQVAADEEGGVA